MRAGSLQGHCLCGCGERTRKRNADGDFDHRAPPRRAVRGVCLVRQEARGKREAVGVLKRQRLRKKTRPLHWPRGSALADRPQGDAPAALGLLETPPAAKVATVRLAPPMPALAGAAEVTVPVAVPEVPCASPGEGDVSAAEGWLLQLREAQAEPTLGKSASYRWLAVAVGLLLAPKTTLLLAKFSARDLWLAFLAALAITASKLESGEAQEALRFRRGVAALVGDVVAFKEASLRLVHCFVPANAYADSQCGA